MIRFARIASRAVEANSSAPIVRGFGRAQSPAVLLELARVLLEQPAQVAVGDDADQAAGGVDDRGDAHHLARHLVDGLGHRRGRAHARDALAGPHEVADLQESPAEAAGRMQRGEVLLA